MSAHNVDVCKFGGDEDERYLAFFEFKLEKKEESSYGGPLVFLMRYVGRTQDNIA